MRRKVDTLQTSIQHWRAKSRQLARETEERNRLLLAEKHTIQKHYQQLKTRIKTYRSNQTQRLLHLSQMANTCMTRLSSKLETARSLMGVTELSRKMETDEERVRPFLSEISQEVCTHPICRAYEVKRERTICFFQSSHLFPFNNHKQTLIPK